MANKPPYRAGAILSANQEEVKLLGFGTYVGDEVPPVIEGYPFSEVLNANKITNPKIELDDKSVVWGFQCWWGPEDKIKETIGSRPVVMVDVNGNIK